VTDSLSAPQPKAVFWLCSRLLLCLYLHYAGVTTYESPRCSRVSMPVNPRYQCATMHWNPCHLCSTRPWSPRYFRVTMHVNLYYLSVIHSRDEPLLASQLSLAAHVEVSILAQPCFVSLALFVHPRYLSLNPHCCRVNLSRVNPHSRVTKTVHSHYSRVRMTVVSHYSPLTMMSVGSVEAHVSRVPKASHLWTAL